MRKIVINKVLNGFIVEVGCQVIVITDQSVLFAELARYIANPTQVEKEYLQKFASDKQDTPMVVGQGGTANYERTRDAREYASPNKSACEPTPTRPGW